MDYAATPERMSGHFHAVRFYENKESLCRIVAEFLAEGMVSGQPALIIATPEHRDAVVQELRARHFDIDKLQAGGDLILLDAREALSAFMVDGQPDAARFTEMAARVFTRVCRGRKDCTIRAYGEMVDLLWKDGFTVAAVRLEMLWNQLAMTHDFSLLCGYAMGSFYKDAGVADICGQHSHVLSADGTAAPVRVPPTTIS
jgi:uroporphyrinogen-III synthase